MDPHSLNRRIEELKQQSDWLSAQLTTLLARRERVTPGSREYTLFSGDIDRLLTDLEDTRTDLRFARQQRRTLASDLGFYAVYMASDTPVNSQQQ